MADGLYVGMSAAAARAAQLESVADNLANAQTPGFKATRPAFQSFLSQGGPSDKIMASAVATGFDLRPGVTVPTDSPLHIAPNDDRFLAVGLPSGQTAYTRNGEMAVSTDGRLQVAGLPVLSRGGGPLTVPPGSLPSVTPDGQVLVDGMTVGQIALYQLQGPVDKVGPSLFIPSGNGTAQEVNGTVRVGELEMGNAPPLEAAIQMITAQRHFDAAMQAIQTYKRMDERAVEVGRVR